MKGNPKMISTDTHQQFNRALKPAIAKPFPLPTRNNNTMQQLGIDDSPMEVFPPEVFFKGTLSANMICNARFSNRKLTAV